MNELEYMRESLIQSGFNRDAIDAMSDGFIRGLFEAWDKEDPDEQWESVDRFFLLNHMDVERVLQV